MQTKHPILDDIAKVAGGASGLVLGIKNDVENTAKSCIESYIDKADLITRTEFEVVKTMAQKAREENQNLQDQISELKKEIQRLKRSKK